MKGEIVFCSGGGCTAKLGQGALSHVLGMLPAEKNTDLLIGFESADDAAVYRLTEELAVIQTLDFFQPMVEDPYLFGQIAAANALSDVYAMGGDVKLALNIVCFPEKSDLNDLGKILQGGNEKVMEAGGVLAGGHSIADSTVKYGLSVMGTVHPDRIFKNNGCKSGDILILTKPLGVGLVSAAARIGRASAEAREEAVNVMTALNRNASEIVRRYRVNGCTDVTGFGFAGHLCEMLGDRFTAVIDSARIPCIRESREYAEEFYLTAAGQRNRNHVGGRVEFSIRDFGMEELLFDPQTSGGLLVSMDPADAQNAAAELAQHGMSSGIVGRITEKQEKSIYVQ